MKYAVVIWFMLSIFPLLSSAQDSTISSNKTELFPKEYGDKNWKILIGLDARRSFFAGTKVKINGLKLGAEYKGVHRFGLGFYWLNRNIVFDDIAVGEANQDLNDPEVRFTLGYSSIFYERIFLKTRWWEVAFPIHLGGGSITGTYKDTLGAYPQFVSRPFSALLPSAQVKFYPLTWLAIRVSGGYRLTFNTQPEVKQAFRTVYYGYGLSINPLEFYRAIFKKKKNEKNTHPENEEESGEGDERR
jgi:hypothetical protein